MKAEECPALEVFSACPVSPDEIRVNDQWRIVFRWELDGPHDVSLTGYH